MRLRIFLVAALLSIVLPASQSSAATAMVRDGSTLQLGNITFRLDGVDVPTIDQLCIDEHADVWTCGIEARDQLSKLIDRKQVRCDDLGVDPTYKKRRIGVCKIEGETTSLSELLVQKGFALNIEASASGRFKPDEARARDDRQGLWKGCFVAPREFRAGKQDGPLLGAACRPDREREIRETLFPEDLAMPAGCNIKGKYAVRARVTGNVGIYHLQACRSYPGLKQDRWFCSEEQAQAEGFRRAYNCRSPSKGK
ncbi:thermonuclease family protein [Bradyrhizobium sp. WSM 1738]|uniref:thermonuclease family protein n=1 Tax=Bradyrhizobium hereditatis TaxID=2821405 RepID=UPI001CE2643B|nr:thermonuclease family protein [Bradyrhizobium hereditatis]MCA6117233.1 thermonuclease family protein [Bradyrhizobium hereditatis]